jgi:hypothetical protein
MKTTFEKIPNNTTYQPITNYGQTTDEKQETAKVKSLKINKLLKEVILVDKFKPNPNEN